MIALFFVEKVAQRSLP